MLLRSSYMALFYALFAITGGNQWTVSLKDWRNGDMLTYAVTKR